MSIARFIRPLLQGKGIVIPQADPLHLLRDPRLSRLTLRTRGNGGILYVIAIPQS